MKSFEPFTFRHIRNVPIERIQELVSQLTEEQWLENTSRQVTFENHSLTQTYFLHNHPLEWSINEPYQGTITYPDSELWSAVYPIVDFLEQFHGGRVGRVMFPKLMAGGDIQPHQDGGDYLDIVRRHHIAIFTAPEVLFFVDGRGINMREGELWEINNMLRHEVRNPSSIDRVHLMVDIIPNRYLGE
jgi:hypothetical protein